MTSTTNKIVRSVAKAGYITKGILYCLVGFLAFMAAFKMGGQSSHNNTDKEGVLQLIKQQIGGQILLGSVALGLVCYGIWRMIQAISDTEEEGTDTKGILIRARYLFSGLVYSSVALLAIKILTGTGGSSADSNKQYMVQSLLSKPFGQWMVGIVAAIIAGIGIYEAYFGLSGKFKKHVDKSVSENSKKLVLSTGKVGYVARGIVWLLIGILFARAAILSSSAEAGSTSEAFQFLSEASYGSYLVAALGLGLIFYGAFNFVRARYENFSVE